VLLLGGGGFVAVLLDGLDVVGLVVVVLEGLVLLDDDEEEELLLEELLELEQFCAASWLTVSIPCKPRWSAVTFVTTAMSLRS